MTEKDAISVLVQAASIGQKNGIYSFKDSALIYQAICVLSPDAVKEFEENNKQDSDKEKTE